MPMKTHRARKTRQIHPIMFRLPITPGLVLKEPVSAVSHFLGACGALVALSSLAFMPVSNMTALQFASFIGYCLSMFAVFMASALYHGYPASLSLHKLLNKLDHAMIYVFIAGSYVPIFLVGTPNSTGIPVVAAVTAIGAVGVCLEFFRKPKNRILGSLTYLLMGWVGIFGFGALLSSLPSHAVWLIAIGGVLYSIGAVFYAIKRPNPCPRVFGFHEIFHLFVLAGSICHFWVVWFVILPMALQTI